MRFVHFSRQVHKVLRAKATPNPFSALSTTLINVEAAGQEIQEHYFLKFNADGRLNSFEQQGHVSHIYKKATVDCKENDSPAEQKWISSGFRVILSLCTHI